MIRAWRSLMALPSILVMIACAGNSGSNATPEDASRESQVAARVGDRVITVSELDNYLKEAWFEEQAGDPDELYELRREGIDALIDAHIREAEAARRDMTVEALLETEAAALPPVSDEEIDSFYDKNRDRIRSDATLEELRPRIRRYLMEERRNQVVSNLRAAQQVEIAIGPTRYQLPMAGVVRGPESAAVTVVVFSDYQCPFCKRAEGTIDTLYERYPGQLQVNYRHLPLDFHEAARDAALASVCAEKSPSFWQFHKALFEQQTKLSRESILAHAEALGLEQAAIGACMDDPATNERVDADIRIAKAAGATSTPTFFVNGIRMRGAQPVENFEKAIDAELKAEAGTSSR